jgi:single-stranded DNA-specific DHH superfamily exonuclease
MADASTAGDRLLAAIARGETILVHGDYDVDGVSAAALYTL